MKEILLYVGATGAQLQLHATLPDAQLVVGLSDTELEHTKRALAASAGPAGADLVCHFQREPSQLEVHPGSAESKLAHSA